MKCPTCTDSTLVLSNRENVEIDYCPDCRGVWLDRGELDKIIERANAGQPAPAPTQAHAPAPTYASAQHSSRPDFVDSDFQGQRYSQGKRKKSWLNEIFD
jgi:uncharacterized protein